VKPASWDGFMPLNAAHRSGSSMTPDVPPDDQMALWRQDYQTMRGEIFFGNVPKFDEILRVVGDFEKRFNKSPTA
jgi:hypothetical protein